MTVTEDEKQFVKLEEDMAAAIVANDYASLDNSLHTEWVVMGESGRITTKDDFLGAIKSGALTHSSMEFDGWRIRAFPEAAVASCTARSVGAFQGEDFTTHEASTSVYVKLDGKWQCILTQLTPIVES